MDIQNAIGSIRRAARTTGRTQQLGAVSDDRSRGVSADGQGNVFISGTTDGDLGGPSAGGSDAFVVKINDVPEPGGAVLLLLGLVSLIGCNRRRSKR